MERGRKKCIESMEKVLVMVFLVRHDGRVSGDGRSQIAWLEICVVSEARKPVL